MFINFIQGAGVLLALVAIFRILYWIELSSQNLIGFIMGVFLFSLIIAAIFNVSVGIGSLI